MKKIAFTIVLNGMPYIKKQMEIIPEIFDEWYIIEGVVKPILDTSWCKSVPKKYYSDKFLSVDGTSEYLEQAIKEKPNVTVIRKYNMFDGKLEMCNTLRPIMKDCILMQFDVDEIWNPDTLRDVLDYCEKNEGFDGLLFPCNYYVGEGLKVVNEGCYGNYDSEWARLWVIRSKNPHWVSHEPPKIYGLNNIKGRDFAKSKGWGFDHYSYVNKEQVQFKQDFYGYDNAVESWQKLQLVDKFPVKLKDYLPWVKDNAIVDKV